VRGDTLTFAIPTAGARYVGVLSAGDSVRGTFTQGPGALPLALGRAVPGAAAPSARRPQNPASPFPYRTQDVTFESVPGVRLAGTLVIPPGPGPFPAVVFVTGSGPQNRDEELFEHRPFAVFADRLARAGIASLRADDRGVGASTGTSAPPPVPTSPPTRRRPSDTCVRAPRWPATGSGCWDTARAG
jgi:hypothetical protein